ncbi:MAG: DUF2240 family protein [Candidatus Hodarchaeota archaeon]
MAMTRSDILKVVAFPFRIYNVKQLDIDTFVFALSFQAFENCNISTAKKILHIAIEQEKVKRVNNSIMIQFDPWTLEIPINWEPEFKGLEKIPEAELKPLPDTPPLEIKPISFEIEREESLTEPFQYDKELLKAMKVEAQQMKKGKIERAKIETKSKKIKKQVKKLKKEAKKQKTIIETTKKIKKIKKTEKVKKKKKTLFDYMNK